jgi:hypothetical protein
MVFRATAYFQALPRGHRWILSWAVGGGLVAASIAGMAGGGRWWWLVATWAGLLILARTGLGVLLTVLWLGVDGLKDKAGRS